MKLLRLERKGERLASRSMFLWCWAISVGVALLVLLATLLVGMAFYHSLRPTSSWAHAFTAPQ